MKFDFDITANPEHRVSEMTEHARNWTETERTAGERKVESMAHGVVCVWLYSEQGQKARTAIVEFRIFALQPTHVFLCLAAWAGFFYARPRSPSLSLSLALAAGPRKATRHFCGSCCFYCSIASIVWCVNVWCVETQMSKPFQEPFNI